MPNDLSIAVREALNEVARLAVDVDSLDENADLYVAGLNSHAAVDVILALEDRFDIEFPPEMLTREVVQTIGHLVAAVSQLAEQAA